MSELARVLRDARKVQNIALDEAERATKIRRRYLEAIEAGDFDQLPDGPPARGFVKNYARFLSLDGEQAIADFEAEVGVPVIYAREHIPPPPNQPRQRRRSSYTQLEAPRLHYKGRLPSPNVDLEEEDEYEDRDARERDSNRDRDHDRNRDDNFGRGAIGNDYNLGFDDDDEMARYRPRNYRMDDDAPNEVNGNGHGNGRESSRRRVLPPRKQRLRANKSSFRLQGKSGGSPKGFALSPGVPEISTVLPPRSRMNPVKAPSVGLHWPEIPQQVFVILGGIVGVAALAALVVLVILPAIRTSTFFSRITTSSAPRPTSSVPIAVTIMAPIKMANTPAAPGASSQSPDSQTSGASTDTGVLPDANPAAPAANTTPAAPAPQVPANANGIQLALDAREHAWVRVKVDGNVVYEGMPPIGPTMPWSAKNKISIETGNAGAFEVIVNGVRTGAIGERNTVARKVWDLSGQMQDGE